MLELTACWRKRKGWWCCSIDQREPRRGVTVTDRGEAERWCCCPTKRDPEMVVATVERDRMVVIVERGRDEGGR